MYLTLYYYIINNEYTLINIYTALLLDIRILTVSVAINVRFDHANYHINEDSGAVLLQLILSNPSSFDENVTLINTDNTANGT